jgi:hypothetical protein
MGLLLYMSLQNGSLNLVSFIAASKIGKYIKFLIKLELLKKYKEF